MQGDNNSRAYRIGGQPPLSAKIVSGPVFRKIYVIYNYNYNYNRIIQAGAEYQRRLCGKAEGVV